MNHDQDQSAWKESWDRPTGPVLYHEHRGGLAAMLRRKSVLGGLIALMAIVIVLVSGIPSSSRHGGKRSTKTATARKLPAGYDAALKDIDRWQGSSSADEGEAILQEAREHRGSIQKALVWLVGRHSHPRHADAVAFVAALDGDAADTGAGHTSPADAEGDGSEDGGVEDPLITALADADPYGKASAIAAIGASGCATEETQLAVIDQLNANLETDRDAACDALPSRLCPNAVTALLDLLGSDSARRRAVRVLARLEATAEQQAEILAALESPIVDGDPEVLDELGGLVRLPGMKPLLWKLALSNDAPAESRTTAMRMLDDLDCAPTEIPTDVSAWPLRMRYFAAHMLCRDHQERGIDMLLGVTDGTSGDADLEAATWTLLASLAALAPLESRDKIRETVKAPGFVIPKIVPPAARL